MVKRTVCLSAQIERDLAELVANGQFQTRSEVIRAACRFWLDKRKGMS